MTDPRPSDMEKAFSEQNPHPVLCVSQEGIVLYANPAATALLAEWPCLVGGRAPEPVRRRLAAALESGARQELEIHCGERDFSFLFVPITSDGYVNIYGYDITARKQAEQALRMNEEQFRAIFEFASVGMAQADPRTGRWLRVNQKMCAITGYSEGELLGMRISEITHPEDRQRDWEAFQRVVRGETPHYRIEKRYLRKDGAVAWVSVNMTILREAEGRPTRSVAIIEDVGARKRAEAVLRESEERYRSLFENMLNGYAFCRMYFDQERPQDFIYLAVNGAFETLTGLERVVGKRVSEVIPGIRQTDPELFEIYGRVALTGKPERFETYVEALGMWFDISVYSPAREYFVAVFDVITERKRNETALRESEQRVRWKLNSILSPEGNIGHLELADIIDVPAIQTLMDHFYRLARIPMSIVDLKGILVAGVGWQEVCTGFHRVHPETCRHCLESDTQLSAGIPPGEFRLYKCKNNMWDIATPIVVGGQHVGNLFSGQFFFEGEQLDYELFRAQAREYGFNEEEYLAALAAAPRLSRESVEAGMAFFIALTQMLSQLSYSSIKLARSLAERDALMDSLCQREEQLRESLAEKTALLNEVHHRVKNNLQVVASLLNLQANRVQDRRIVEVLQDTGNRVRSMGLLHETLYRSGNLARINFAAYAEELCRQLMRSFGSAAARVQVENRVARIGLPLEQAVPCGLIINELVSNALKHGYPDPRTGKVAVELRPAEGQQFILCVSDDGVGLPPDFDPANSSTLGLELVSNLAGQLGGYLTIERPTGARAAFSVVFSIAEDILPENSHPEGAA